MYVTCYHHKNLTTWIKMCIHWGMEGCLGSPDLIYNVHADEGQLNVFTLITIFQYHGSGGPSRCVCSAVSHWYHLCYTSIYEGFLEETKLSCPGFACALYLKMLILLVNEGEGDSTFILCRDREGWCMCIGDCHSFQVTVSNLSYV